jgi:hypothetical protein
MLREDSVARADVEDGCREEQPAVQLPRPAEEVIDHPFWIQTNDPPRVVSIPPWVLDVVTEGSEMLVLAQLNYWFRLGDSGDQLRAQVEIDGHLWLAKTYTDLGVEVRRNQRQVKKAVKALKEKGFVIVKPGRSRFYHGQVVSHFRLDWDAIARAHQGAEQIWKEGAGENGLL